MLLSLVSLISDSGLRGDLSPGCHGYRTLSQHLSDLKKENFSLKLRIYFLEERVQGQSPDPDLSKTVSKTLTQTPDPLNPDPRPP
ncbi:hypothetical protein NL108_000954 [Boleophthalmus pectinirostris]|nr:hypothetical protein NL108_000954 [Boleophthalmus pectinirostris]